jgi:glutathione synthase
MQQYKLLVFTDHTNHTAENSLYPLLKKTRLNTLCARVDVVSKGNDVNNSFFLDYEPSQIWATSVTDSFEFSQTGFWFKKDIRQVNITDYDFIWLRMRPPLSKQFLKFLAKVAPNQVIVNNPESIYITGSKEFLVNFPQICPPMKICRTVEDIIEFKNQYPIVLKPFREYGGKGIVRIDGEKVWEENDETTFDLFLDKLKKEKTIDYLGVKFLKNVSQGDKRIVVVDGKILGAALRLPAKDAWLCNVSMGGMAYTATVDEEEIHIVNTINPVLSKMGIVMYGVDTLVDDDGKRVLSEINTTSIGGLPQISRMLNQPLEAEAVDLILKSCVRIASSRLA